MADVFYCFVAVVYHVGMLIYLFSRHENFFIRLFPHGRCYSLHFYYYLCNRVYLVQELNYFFARFYWRLVYLLSHFCIVKTLV